MPKYALARENGDKPYVVAVTSWGETHERLIYSDTAGHAAYEAKGRQLYTYAKARRATPEDVDRLALRERHADE